VGGATFKLVEACAGTGDLIRREGVLQRVRYRLDRYQGMMVESGLPIPGLHRIEGSIAVEGAEVLGDVLGADLTLRLEDGRLVRVTLAGTDGAILAEGHGPGRGCSCC
jgi:hypothetical protein